MSISGIALVCLIATVFVAAALGWMWSIRPERHDLLALGIGCIVSACGAALQSIPWLGSPIVASTLGSALLIGGLLVGGFGFCRRARQCLTVSLPVAAMVILATGQAGLMATGYGPVAVLRFGDGVFALTIAGIIHRARLVTELSRGDTIVAFTLGGFAVLYGTRTWIADVITFLPRTDIAVPGGYPVWFYPGFLSLLSISLAAIMVQEISGLVTDLRAARDIDSLTQVYNRGAFYRRAQSAMDANRRSRCADVAVAIGDLDHFKRINDAYGHWTGDRVLERFGTILARQTRGGHIVGRIGGEEFAVLLIGMSAEESARTIQNIRMDLGEQYFDGIGVGGSVTVSFGMVGASGGASLDDLIRTADRLLYLAKNNGRNRTQFEDGRMVGSDTGTQEGRSLHAWHKVTRSRIRRNLQVESGL